MVKRLLVIYAALFAAALPVAGQGIAGRGIGQTNPPVLNSLSLTRYAVEVTASETSATVVVEEVFFNSGRRLAEADFYFPLPAAAAASGLELRMGDRYFGGNLLKNSRARSIYDEITRRSRDPALLECVGKDLYRCRVFPVPARGYAAVRFAYRQPLASDGAMRKLVLPLDAARFNRAPANRFTLKVHIRTEKALQAIFCPTHAVQVERKGLNEAVVSLDVAQAFLAGDLVLHYAVEDAPLGAVVSSCRTPGKPGYFVLSLDAAFAREKQRNAPRDVVVAVDTSNSSGRSGVDAAAAAVAHALTTLGEKDRFALMAFSTEARLLCEFRHPGADQEKLKATVRSLFSHQPPSGRTRLGAALTRASQQAELGLPGTGIILLTDGVSTAPGADPVQVARAVAAGGNRVGVCGVGAQADMVVLDALGESGAGDSAHPVRGSDLARSVSHLLETTRAVPLTDVVVEVGGATQVYPKTQRMLNAGESILVAGRYHRGGEVTVRISGQVSGERVVRTLKVSFANSGGDPAVARMWASRRVGTLLDDARAKNDPDLHKREIQRLGREYGIVTPHSSLLVLEQNDQRHFLKGMRRQPLLRTSGAGLVRRRGTITTAHNPRADVAARIRKLKRAAHGAANPFADLLGKNRARLRRAAGRTFYRGEDGTWVESSLTNREHEQVRQIVFLGEQWTKLAKLDPELAKILSLGRKVMFTMDDAVFQVVEK